eukprot:TRINITY_DN3095_c0_g1_i1.p1 TRINITY_DN3095_c0_g1~~TRINITY_DN3095_c0_g1_i1.p1  ORF type:complete len:938 (+),score=139.68 TRINITY_DN3095_c0_g1_i1:166-2979(+)
MEMAQTQARDSHTAVEVMPESRYPPIDPRIVAAKRQAPDLSGSDNERSEQISAATSGDSIKKSEYFSERFNVLNFRDSSSPHAEHLREVRQRHKGSASQRKLAGVGGLSWRHKLAGKQAASGMPTESSAAVDSNIRMTALEREERMIAAHKHGDGGLWQTLLFAYSSIGVIYGDVGTSPLYTFSAVFVDFETVLPEDIFGAASLILWTLTLIALLKYVFIVLFADDNGEGGTFALYSNLCRHAKLSLLGNEIRPEVASSLERKYRNSLRKSPSEKGAVRRAKGIVEGSLFIRRGLLILVLIATCGVLADGVLTPAISVLSAVQGIGVAGPKLSNTVVLAITSVILVGLFSFQSFGTAKVAFIFAPVCALWFSAIALIGAYNIAKYDPTVFKVISPHYGVNYFMRNGFQAWKSLGGIVLCITGTEAMFADMGHFSRSSIQIAFSSIVYPSLIITYLGQAAYLAHNTGDVSNAFFASTPTAVFYPMLVLSALSAVVASQALISGSFSIIQQSMTLECFPPLQVVHTSDEHAGQVYLPVVNWSLLILTNAVIWGFQSGESIGNAYGVAVMGVMFITTTLIAVVMLVSWEWSFYPVLLFWVFFSAVEGAFLSSTFVKIPSGGWFPIVVAVTLMSIMYTWHYGMTSKAAHDDKTGAVIRLSALHDLMEQSQFSLIPSMMVVYGEKETGVPPVYSHYITNIPAVSQVCIFLTVKHLPVPKLNDEDRFAVFRLSLPGFYRVIAYYGYTETVRHDDEFPVKLCDFMVDAFFTPEKEKGHNVGDPNLPRAIDGCEIVPELQEAEDLDHDKVSLRSDHPSFPREHSSVHGPPPSTWRLKTRSAPVGISSSEEPSLQHNASEQGQPRMSRDFSEATGGEVRNLVSAVDSGTVYLSSRVELVPMMKNPFHRIMLEVFRVFKALGGDEIGMYNIPRGSSVEVGMVYEVTT